MGEKEPMSFHAILEYAKIAFFAAVSKELQSKKAACRSPAPSEIQ